MDTVNHTENQFENTEDDNFLLNINLTQMSQNQSLSASPSYSPIPAVNMNVSQVNNSSSLQEDPFSFLHHVDPEKSLSIWNLLSYKGSDKLVDEYLSNLERLRIKPCIPDKSRLLSLQTPHISLPLPCQIEVIDNFTAYFQCRYSTTNINSALEHDVTLFSPYINFNIPQHQLLPKFYFDETKNDKISFVKAIQSNAVEGLAFTTELLLLRILNIIASAIIAEKKESESVSVNDLEYFFLTFYQAAQANFHEKFKVKTINWQEKVGRVKEGLPAWRVKGLEAPKVKPSRYSKELTKKLAEAKVRITKLGIVKNDTDAIVQNKNSTTTENPADPQTLIQSNASSSSVSITGTTPSVKKGRQDTGTCGVKELTKIRGSPQSLKKPPPNRFDKGRNLENLTEPIAMDISEGTTHTTTYPIQ